MATSCFRNFVSLGIVVSCWASVIQAEQECSPGTVSGVVYDDRNSNAVQDSGEPGVPGVAVRAVSGTGAVLQSMATRGDGAFAFPLGGTVSAKIEFSNFPLGFRPGLIGAASKPSVSFVTGESCSHNLALTSDGTLCPGEPRLSTSCFANGDPLVEGTAATTHTLVSFPYSAQNATPSALSLATAQQLGAVWGLAYQRGTRRVYAGAFMKRHAGLGPLGTGGIYAIDSDTGSVVPFVDLAALGISTGPDPRQPGDLTGSATEPSYDIGAWPAVGKVGLGDLEMAENDQDLYAMNLFNKTLYRLPIGPGGSAPQASAIESLPIPNPGCTNGDYEPWAVTEHLGSLYVGVACTAETSGLSSDLAAKILKRVGAGWQIVFEMPLANYSRGYTLIPGLFPLFPDFGGQNKPWLRTFSDLMPNVPPTVGAFIIWPQLALSSIQFEVDGSMVLGFVDRTAHQFGPFNTIPVLGSQFIAHGPSTGDTIRVFRSNGGYILEDNGGCDACSPAIAPSLGRDNLQGPGGGEFFYWDADHRSIPVPGAGGPSGGSIAVDIHQEITTGAVALLPGTGESVVTSFNPLNVRETGGVRVFDNSTGELRRSYQVYGEGAPGTFGKAAGLGDLELLCDAPTQQIGDRVWLDSDGDGVQDAGEPGISGVTVQLVRADTGAVVATRVSGSDGSFLFGSSDGIAPSTNYVLRLGQVSDFASGGSLAGLVVTTLNGSGDDQDSDAVEFGQVVEIALRSGSIGVSNHSYDFGFVAPQCSVKNFGSVSAAVDSNAAFLRDISRQVVSLIERNVRARRCESDLRISALKRILARQEGLYHEVWTMAWSLPTTSLECVPAQRGCVSVSTLGFRSQLTTDIAAMKAGLDTFLKNKCGRTKGFKGRFASYRRQVRKALVQSTAQVASLGTSIASCS